MRGRVPFVLDIFTTRWGLLPSDGPLPQMEKPCPLIPTHFTRGYQNCVHRPIVVHHLRGRLSAGLAIAASQPGALLMTRSRLPRVFNNDFALITEGQVIPRPEVQCQRRRGVPWSTPSAATTSASPYVGDTTYWEEAAREVVRRLSFGPASAAAGDQQCPSHRRRGRFLAELADIATPSGFLFVAFRIRRELIRLDGCEPAACRGHLHRGSCGRNIDQGMPESLVGGIAPGCARRRSC